MNIRSDHFSRKDMAMKFPGDRTSVNPLQEVTQGRLAESIQNIANSLQPGETQEPNFFLVEDPRACKAFYEDLLSVASRNDWPGYLYILNNFKPLVPLLFCAVSIGRRNMQRASGGIPGFWESSKYLDTLEKIAEKLGGKNLDQAKQETFCLVSIIMLPSLLSCAIFGNIADDCHNAFEHLLDRICVSAIFSLEYLMQSRELAKSYDARKDGDITPFESMILVTVRSMPMYSSIFRPSRRPSKLIEDTQKLIVDSSAKAVTEERGVFTTVGVLQWTALMKIMRYKLFGTTLNPRSFRESVIGNLNRLVRNQEGLGREEAIIRFLNTSSSGPEKIFGSNAVQGGISFDRGVLLIDKLAKEKDLILKPIEDILSISTTGIIRNSSFLGAIRSYLMSAEDFSSNINQNSAANAFEFPETLRRTDSLSQRKSSSSESSSEEISDSLVSSPLKRLASENFTFGSYEKSKYRTDAPHPPQ